jgi:hypothetical protein
MEPAKSNLVGPDFEKILSALLEIKKVETVITNKDIQPPGLTIREIPTIIPSMFKPIERPDDVSSIGPVDDEDYTTLPYPIKVEKAPMSLEKLFKYSHDDAFCVFDNYDPDADADAEAEEAAAIAEAEAEEAAAIAEAKADAVTAVTPSVLAKIPAEVKAEAEAEAEADAESEEADEPEEEYDELPLKDGIHYKHKVTNIVYKDKDETTRVGTFDPETKKFKRDKTSK